VLVYKIVIVVCIENWLVGALKFAVRQQPASELVESSSHLYNQFLRCILVSASSLPVSPH
jgi:hypothetical protein